jgi:hypothetical protein
MALLKHLCLSPLFIKSTPRSLVTLSH